MEGLAGLGSRGHTSSLSLEIPPRFLDGNGLGEGEGEGLARRRGLAGGVPVVVVIVVVVVVVVIVVIVVVVVMDTVHVSCRDEKKKTYCEDSNHRHRHCRGRLGKRATIFGLRVLVQTRIDRFQYTRGDVWWRVVRRYRRHVARRGGFVVERRHLASFRPWPCRLPGPLPVCSTFARL